MSDLLADLRYALRLATLSPVFTGAAVLTLALGIGATTAIYALADATLLRPLPVRDVDSLYGTRWSASYPAFRDYLARTDTFDGVVAFSGRDTFSLQRGSSTALAAGAFVSGNYFDVLGIGPQLGRILLPSDDGAHGGALVAVLSDGYWRTQCHADPAIVGTTLRVNGRAALVVGVAARGFRGVTLQADPAFWMPLSSFREIETAPFFRRVDPLKSRGLVWLRLVMRLKPGVTPEQAGAVIAATYKANHAADPEAARDADEAAQLHPLKATAVGFSTQRDLSRFLLLLGGVVGFTLLIACANLANMLLVRATARRREIAVRLALGARRGRLVRQMLTENLLLALAGGTAGLFVARWMIALLARFQLPGEIPIEGLRLGLGWRSRLTVALAASLGTAVLFGLVPALRASALGIVGALRDQARATSRHRLRGALITAQVALSLVLLAGGALFVRGLERALRTELGFRSEGVATASVDLGLARYEAARARQFYDSALDRLYALPSVRAAAWASHVPMRGVMMWTIEVDGFTPPKGRSVHADVAYVYGRYFPALGIPVLEGRALDGRDREGAPLAAVVNRAMAAKFWAGRAALGGRFRFDEKGPWVDVVGIAGDVRGRAIDEEVMPTMYLPFLQHQEGHPAQRRDAHRPDRARSREHGKRARERRSRRGWKPARRPRHDARRSRPRPGAAAEDGRAALHLLRAPRAGHRDGRDLRGRFGGRPGTDARARNPDGARGARAAGGRARPASDTRAGRRRDRPGAAAGGLDGEARGGAALRPRPGRSDGLRRGGARAGGGCPSRSLGSGPPRGRVDPAITLRSE